MTTEDIDQLFRCMDRAAQDRAIVLGRLCAGNQNFEWFVRSVIKEIVPEGCEGLIDHTGIRMVIVGAMQMALDWAEGR